MNLSLLLFSHSLSPDNNKSISGLGLILIDWLHGLVFLCYLSWTSLFFTQPSWDLEVTLDSSPSLFPIASLCVCAQSCLTLCQPIDFGRPGSSVYGILQARWVAGMGCHFLLQGIFPTRGLNTRLLHLLHWQVDSLPLHPWEATPTIANSSYHCAPGKQPQL